MGPTPTTAALGALLLQGQGEDSFKQLIQLGFLVLFILLPVIRSVTQNRKKREAAGRGTQGPKTAEPKAGPRRGRTLWEMLEKGLEVEGPERRPAPQPREPAEKEWTAEVGPTVVTENVLEERGGTPEPGPMVELAPSTSVASFEPETDAATFEPSTDESSFVPSTVHAAFEPSTDRAAMPRLPDSASPVRSPRAHLDLPDSAARWRRAVILYEVLGPPVSMGGGGERLRPPALS